MTKIIPACAVFVLAAIAATAMLQGKSPHTITHSEAKRIIYGSKAYILLDVRTDTEFKEGHIPKATLIPDYEIKRRAAGELPDKNAMILVYCRSGRRSKNAAKNLADMGYVNVYDMGGIIDWPYETTAWQK